VGATDFDALQQRLVPLWHSIRALSDDEQTIVVVPSVSFEFAGALGSIVQAYEERYLFLLFLLRQPRARLVYVTSRPVPSDVIDYYLGLMPGVIPSHARARLHLVSADDGSGRSLTEKLLERPRLLRRIRSLIPDPHRAHLVPFVTTEAERDLAVALSIPMYASDPKFFPLGTKSGCRRLFAQEGVAHPAGFEDLRSVGEVVEAIAKMRAERPAMESVVVKLDEGISGLGNMVVHLDGLPAPGAPTEHSAIEKRLYETPAAAGSGSFEELAKMIGVQACVVEERIAGAEVRSPSVQMRVTPLGDLEVLSTHDQLLGGPDGQAYEGCVFPADTAYAAAITQEAVKVGRRLAREGVLGRFAIDFVVVRDGAEPWRAYAIELNLRKGGTTHPFLTLQFLTDGTYDADTGEFRAPNGTRKYFVASDHVHAHSFHGLTVEDLFDIVMRRGLHFDHARQTGIVMHMMSAVTEHGRLGLTAVADSHADADALYQRAQEILVEEATKG
jgi:hypothetical protein